MKRKEKTFGLIAAFALAIAVAISFRVMGNGVAFAEDGYRITFDANGHGTVPAPITVTVYINWENPETPSDPDYAFFAACLLKVWAASRTRMTARTTIATAKISWK